jgi:starch synthase
MLLTGLDWKYFNWQQMEFHGYLNLLKTGLVFADSVNTVSPRYAQEIQSPALGCGLEGTLQQRRDVLSGILNGMDTGHWNPATDSHLAEKYTVDSYEKGKAACKAALQKEVGLPERPDAPLVGLIGRLCEQKGVDLVVEVMGQWAKDRDVQWVVLGTGDQEYHEKLADLAKRYPEKIAAKLMFSGPLSHQIEAGSDMFLMPSSYEPCGLNQMYSLAYGTVPVVRSTGGLADTIVDASDEAIQAGTANGFSFGDYSSLALAEALERACTAYGDKKIWNQLITTGMRQDWSWSHSARQYLSLYAKTVERRKQEAHVS